MMPTSLVLPLALLFTGTVGVFILGRVRPALAGFMAAVITGVSMLFWLPLELQLPLGYLTAADHPLGRLNTLVFRVTEPIYQLSFYLLLTVFAAQMAAVGKRLGQPEAPRPGPVTFPALLLLTATGLLAVWAASPAALLGSWTLLASSWLVFVWVCEPVGGNAKPRLARFGAMAASQFFLLLAATSVPAPLDTLQDPGAWPATAKIWAGLAAAVQLGALPFHWWRPDGGRPDAGRPAAWVALVVRSVPVAAGASLLLRLRLDQDGPLFLLVLLTLLGLLGMLAGTLRAWSHIADQRSVAEALAMALSGLLLLAAVWTGAEAIVAQTRVLLLTVAAFYLIDVRETAPTPRWRLGATLLVVAAMLGLPFTAGFTGLARLYEAWPGGGGTVLIMVTVTLLVGLGGSLLLTLWRRSRWLGRDSRRQAATVDYVLMAGQLLPLFGLVSLAGPALPSLAVGLAIALGLAGSAFLSRFAGRLTTARAITRQAMQVEIELKRVGVASRSFARSAAAAVREAEAILESEGGLVWLMILLMLVFVAVGLS